MVIRQGWMCPRPLATACTLARHERSAVRAPVSTQECSDKPLRALACTSFSILKTCLKTAVIVTFRGSKREGVHNITTAGIGRWPSGAMHTQLASINCRSDGIALVHAHAYHGPSLAMVQSSGAVSEYVVVPWHSEHQQPRRQAKVRRDAEEPRRQLRGLLSEGQNPCGFSGEVMRDEDILTIAVDDERGGSELYRSRRTTAACHTAIERPDIASQYEVARQLGLVVHAAWGSARDFFYALLMSPPSKDVQVTVAYLM
jgi:hypothetical protein